MKGSIFKEIITDHVDDKGVIHMDGYKSDDPNAEGFVIGFFVNGEIYWRDPEYQFDPYVKEELGLLQKEYEEKKSELKDEIEKAVTRVVYDHDAKPRPEFTNGSSLKVKLGFINDAVKKIMEICKF